MNKFRVLRHPIVGVSNPIIKLVLNQKADSDELSISAVVSLSNDYNNDPDFEWRSFRQTQEISYTTTQRTPTLDRTFKNKKNARVGMSLPKGWEDYQLWMKYNGYEYRILTILKPLDVVTSSASQKLHTAILDISDISSPMKKWQRDKLKKRMKEDRIHTLDIDYSIISMIYTYRKGRNGNSDFNQMKLFQTKFEKFHSHEKYLQLIRYCETLSYPQILSGHGFNIPFLNRGSLQKYYDAMKDLTKTAYEYDYDLFLNSGTLLGVVRDKKLIGHDDDMDLAIILKSKSYTDLAVEFGHFLKNLQLKYDNVEMTSHSIIKVEVTKNLFIDIFPAWIDDENRFFTYPHTRGEYYADTFLPLQDEPITGCKIPKNSEKMLEINYGPNWPRPDPFFKFDWIGSQADFAPMKKEFARVLSRD